MKTLSLTICATLCIGPLGFAQESEAPKAARTKEMTMTGCLNKAADMPQHYSFVDQGTGKKWTVTGLADLEKHSANHTVRITGHSTAKVFSVTKVEHVSGTCEAKGSAPEKGAAK